MTAVIYNVPTRTRPPLTALDGRLNRVYDKRPRLWRSLFSYRAVPVGFESVSMPQLERGRSR